MSNSLKTDYKVLEVKILGVTAPATVCSIAKREGLATEEVFVRVVFEHLGKEYEASQKLKYLPKSDYQDLLASAEKQETMTLSINIEKKFFNVYRQCSLDDLYNTVSNKPAKTTRSELTDLI